MINMPHHQVRLIFKFAKRGLKMNSKKFTSVEHVFLSVLIFSGVTFQFAFASVKGEQKNYICQLTVLHKGELAASVQKAISFTNVPDGYVISLDKWNAMVSINSGARIVRAFLNDGPVDFSNYCAYTRVNGLENSLHLTALDADRTDSAIIECSLD